MSIPKDIDKWDNNKWTKQVVNCRPSSGGAVGVIFVWAGMAYSRQNVQDAKMAAFVIKPIQGSAAPTKFAEHILSKIGGAISPNSKPIPRRSHSGSGLMLTLKMFRDRETIPTVKDRWQQVFSHYDRADAFLIQETQIGIKEFGDEYREQSGLATMLLNTDLMFNLGKLFAADALIGNGDRLGSPNTGNIVFKSDGTLSSIDSTTILTNFQAIISDVSLKSNSAGGPDMSPNYWAANDVIKYGYQQVPSPVQMKQANPTLAPSMGVEVLFNVDNWWTKIFRSHLEDGLRKEAISQKVGVAPPSETAWEHGKMHFKKGVDEGIRQIDMRLSGLNWLMMKNTYKSFVSRYGGDPNLDWTNFKIRRKYIKLRKKGISEDQALATIQEYVRKGWYLRE